MFVCVYFSHCWIYKAFLQWRCPLFGTLTTPIPTPTPTTSTTPMPSFSSSSTAWRVEAILSSFTTETLIWAAGILQFTFSMSQRVCVCVCVGSRGGSVLVSGAGAGARVSVCVWVSSCLEWARLDKCFGCHLLQALGQRRFLDRRRGTRHWNHWHGTNLGFDYLQAEAQILGTVVRRWRGGWRTLMHQHTRFGLNGNAGRRWSRNGWGSRCAGEQRHVHQLLHGLARILWVVHNGSGIAVYQRRYGVTIIVLHIRRGRLQRYAAHNHVGRRDGRRTCEQTCHSCRRLFGVVEHRQRQQFTTSCVAALLHLNVLWGVLLLVVVLLLDGVVVGAPGSQALL